MTQHTAPHAYQKTLFNGASTTASVVGPAVVAGPAASTTPDKP